MKQVNVLNSKLLSIVDQNFPIDLARGKLGFCIYFYYLSRWEDNNEYKLIAEKMLDDVVSRLSETRDITVESGLAGIAIGISHLVKEKFIEGDVNEILEDVDSAIFKKIAFLPFKDIKNKIQKADLIHLLYYLYVRYIEQINVDNKYLFQELIIKVIEMFKDDLQETFFKEPFSLSLQNFRLPLFLYIINKIYELDIYKDRITKILEEYVFQFLSVYPILQANRLYFLCGLINIQTCLPGYKKEIDSHIQLLKNSIDIDYIINTEMRNQDIYMVDGVSSVYLLLFYLQTQYPRFRIEYDLQLFFDKIYNSEAWSTLLNQEFYFRKYNRLFEGFPGAYLILLHIKKNLS